MSKSFRILLLGCGVMKWSAALCVLAVLGGGCGNKFLDPTQIGRFRQVPTVNVILDSLGVAVETPSAWEGAEEPKPVDIMVYETDYTFHPSDVVRIQIFELLRVGETYTNQYIVTETGKISIPYVGVVEVAGLTESQLEEEISQLLAPNILKEPLVTATLINSPERAFSILGEGVLRPDRYIIPRYNFRLSDALAFAGGISQFNVSYIYVSRALTGEEAIARPMEKAKLAEPKEIIAPEQELLEIIAPSAQGDDNLRMVIASTEMVTDKELSETALPDDFKMLESLDDKGELSESTALGTVDELFSGGETGRIEWVFQDGRWVPVRVGGPSRQEVAIKDKPQEEVKPLKEKIPEGLAWEQIGRGGLQTRVIKIVVDKLLGGDPRYNIVIKPGDTVHVPVDIIGEFCIMGNVNNTGFIPITGRPLTLKMAIAAAGGLGPLAWPKRCEVVRRIGKNREETVMVDLDKIARGEQPDFFIKPNDLINVGTHVTTRWRAALRNAFFASYGFGFNYSRNFAYDSYYGF